MAAYVPVVEQRVALLGSLRAANFLSVPITSHAGGIFRIPRGQQSMDAGVAFTYAGMAMETNTMTESVTQMVCNPAWFCPEGDIEL